MRRVRFLFFASGILSLALLLSCDKVEEGYNPVGGNVPTNYITINDSSFSPSTLTLVSGSSVTFLNSTRGSHQIITDDSATINTGVLAPQGFFYWKKDIEGSLQFHCLQHPNARGVLILTP